MAFIASTIAPKSGSDGDDIIVALTFPGLGPVRSVSSAESHGSRTFDVICIALVTSTISFVFSHVFSYVQPLNYFDVEHSFDCVIFRVHGDRMAIEDAARLAEEPYVLLNFVSQTFIGSF